MATKKNSDLKIGEVVVYPKHGVGEIEKIENMEISDIKTAYTNSGKPAQGSNDSADVIGSIFVEFEDWKKRNMNGKQIL